MNYLNTKGMRLKIKLKPMSSNSNNYLRGVTKWPWRPNGATSKIFLQARKYGKSQSRSRGWWLLKNLSKVSKKKIMLIARMKGKGSRGNAGNSLESWSKSFFNHQGGSATVLLGQSLSLPSKRTKGTSSSWGNLTLGFHNQTWANSVNKQFTAELNLGRFSKTSSMKKKKWWKS
jgi:hypothetical protein